MAKAEYFKSLRKALSVLKCFNFQQLELSGAEIARKLGMHRTSAYRILAVLAEEGLIERNETKEKYSIGPGLFVLGSLYLNSTSLVRAAEPVLAKLNEMTNELVSMAILDKRDAVYIMVEESKHPVGYSRRVGSVFPAYSTAMGRALLSEMEDAEIDRLYPEEKLLALTPKTISTKTELKSRLEQIRKTGVSFESGGAIENVEGIASPVRDANGKIVAAISFAVPFFRMDSDRRNRLAALISAGANYASYRLGYNDSRKPIRSLEEVESLWKASQTKAAVLSYSQSS